MVTWGSGRLDLNAGAAGAPGHLPEVTLPSGHPAAPEFLSFVTSCISMMIYFLLLLPRAVGLFVVLETSSPEEKEVFGSNEFIPATNSWAPALGALSLEPGARQGVLVLGSDQPILPGCLGVGGCISLMPSPSNLTASPGGGRV